MAQGPEHLTKTEARAGTTPGMARPVLIISLLLVLIAFGALLIYFMRG